VPRVESLEGVHGSTFNRRAPGAVYGGFGWFVSELKTGQYRQIEILDRVSDEPFIQELPQRITSRHSPMNAPEGEVRR
jgi:hypothetical protein